ncbi:hypothetical protein LR393_31690 [Kineosporia mesophila]|nr:hypothetical protein [Kineosporia mesophila]
MTQPEKALRSLDGLRPGGLLVAVAPGRPPGFAECAQAASVRVAPEPFVEPDGHGLTQPAALVDSGRLDQVFPLADAARAETGATR